MTAEQANSLLIEIDAVLSEARGLVQRKHAQLTVRQATGGWSVGENIQHLIQTADAMLPLMETGIRELETNGKKATGKTGLGFMGWLLVKMIEPPSRFKVPTTAPFEPLHVPPAAQLLERFDACHERLRALVERAKGRATSTVTVVSPFNAQAKYNLYAAMRIMLAHDRRHLAQAARVG